MAPKIKVTREDIINTSVELVRAKGTDAINARAIATALSCSTQPIFSNFESMEELECETLKRVYEIYLEFLDSELKSEKYPPYKAFGMGYIRFAKEESELFKLLFMKDSENKQFSPTQDFNDSVDMIMKSSGASRELASKFHLELWICVHGISAMLATSYLNIEWDLISDILSDIYQGLRAKHFKENINL